MKTVLILSVLTIISLLSQRAVAKSSSHNQRGIFGNRNLQTEMLGGSTNISSSRNSSHASENHHNYHNSESETPIGVFIGVGCGILFIFAVLIYLLSKRKPMVDSTAPTQPRELVVTVPVIQPTESPVTSTQPIPVEESVRNSEQDETDPNPVQGLPPVQLEAFVSFEARGRPITNNNVVGLPSVGLSLLDPASPVSNSSPVHPRPSDIPARSVPVSANSSPLLGLHSDHSNSPNQLVRPRRRCINRQKN